MESHYYTASSKWSEEILLFHKIRLFVYMYLVNKHYGNQWQHSQCAWSIDIVINFPNAIELFPASLGVVGDKRPTSLIISSLVIFMVYTIITEDIEK